MPRSQRDDYHLLSREQQVVLVRLRAGHNRLNSHMHRKLKLAPSPTWPCGQDNQTTEHVLQRCPLYKATREDVWPVSISLTTKLYGCKQELEKTTSFISRAAMIVQTANAKKKMKNPGLPLSRWASSHLASEGKQTLTQTAVSVTPANPTVCMTGTVD